jgi:hypothetical protein
VFPKRLEKAVTAWNLVSDEDMAASLNLIPSLPPPATTSILGRRGRDTESPPPPRSGRRRREIRQASLSYNEDEDDQSDREEEEFKVSSPVPDTSLLHSARVGSGSSSLPSTVGSSTTAAPLSGPVRLVAAIHLRCSRCARTVPESSCGRFCSACGEAWRLEDRPPTGNIPSTISAATVNVGAGSTSYTFNQTAADNNYIAQAISRLPNTAEIAPLSQALIKKAREGTHLYPLSDLLPSIVKAPSTASLSTPGDTATGFLLKVSSTGTGTTMEAVTGLDGVPISTAAANTRRQLLTMEDLNEVVLHSLIGIIHQDDADLCQQYLALLCLATDITRQKNFATALHYVNSVRNHHFNLSHGTAAAPNLRARGSFSMKAFHSEFHTAAVLALSAATAVPYRQGAAAGSGGPPPPSAPLRNTQICFNYNNDKCNENCGRRHVCRNCQGNHRALVCPLPASSAAGLAASAAATAGGRPGKTGK